MAAHVTSAIPGRRLEIHHVITEGDLAAAHWTMTWHPPPGHDRHAGPDTTIRMQGHDFFRLSGGRIGEIWHCEATRPSS